jgi:2-methylisocitrate lyase-like PEP mutase family enzyme
VDIIMIEDKVFPKKNSLLEDVSQILEDVDVFANKIRAGKAAAGKVKVMARIESLIAKKSVFEALVRAEAYIKAGVDGVMIHSKEKVDCTEIMEFAERFKEKYPDMPLVAVPTTYNLPEDHPFDVVIYANMLLRASLKAMQETIALEDIKQADMVEVQEIFDLVGK